MPVDWFNNQQTKIGIFEDCGHADPTRKWLKHNSIRQPILQETLLEADHWKLNQATSIFLGRENFGVAGNTNRALLWFMEETQATHLVMVNDDIRFTGDVIQPYLEAHRLTGVGLFCFCDATYGEQTGIAQFGSCIIGDRMRMHGSMMSLTRNLIESIGFMDPIFGKFGEEHCDFTHRARSSGFMNIGDQPRHCLDVIGIPAVQQDVKPCFLGSERTKADRRSATIMNVLRGTVYMNDPHRPFCLRKTELVEGIPSYSLDTTDFI